MADEALDVFISYSHGDEAFKDELVKYHLKLLQRENKINAWQDRDIEAGAMWAQEIEVQLDKAQIVLLLVTRKFIASDYCYEIEMQRASKRHYAGTARVIPIILEPCSWKRSPLKDLQVLPQDGKPVIEWPNRASVFLDIENGIRRVIDTLSAERLRQKQATEERQKQEQEAAEERQRQEQEEAERRRVEKEKQPHLSTAPASPKQPSHFDPQTFEFQTVVIRSVQPGGLLGFGQPKVDIHYQKSQAIQFNQVLGNSTLLTMVKIPGGQFWMGSPDSELERLDSEGPQHSVTISEFWMGKYAVTQTQWSEVAALPKVSHDLELFPSNFRGDKRPVECVSWYEAVEFCERLSRSTGRIYRLPSEAEWEYACRARTTTPFHFGETITTDLANYDGNYTYGSGPKGVYRQETIEVGGFPPNAFGVYDMHGNVWEWCADHWHGSYEGAPTDGTAWLSSDESSHRLLRGGSWGNNPRNCRSATRIDNHPVNRNRLIGFRVVCSVARDS